MNDAARPTRDRALCSVESGRFLPHFDEDPPSDLLRPVGIADEVNSNSIDQR